MKRIIGVDVDGVLADFNTAFIDLVVHLTERDLFPKRPFDIPTWNYPEHYGYTAAELSAVWEEIKSNDWFWAKLPSYPDVVRSMLYLTACQRQGDDVYFITSRPGLCAKRQTESWIWERAGYRPTVLISSHKGLCANALELDAYIDDRWENVYDVATVRRDMRVVLLNRPWNAVYGTGHTDNPIVRVDHLEGFAEL
jgi:uncharacterized HAD superfamily protein